MIDAPLHKQSADIYHRWKSWVQSQNSPPSPVVFFMRSIKNSLKENILCPKIKNIAKFREICHNREKEKRVMLGKGVNGR